jgi:predicted HTH transcriptional regulator
MKNLTLDQLIGALEKEASEANFTGIEFKSDWGQSHGRDISAIANCIEIATGWVVIGINNNGRPLEKDPKWLKEVEQKVSQPSSSISLAVLLSDGIGWSPNWYVPKETN